MNWLCRISSLCYCTQTQVCTTRTNTHPRTHTHKRTPTHARTLSISTYQIALLCRHASVQGVIDIYVVFNTGCRLCVPSQPQLYTAAEVHVSAYRGGGNFISHLLTALNLPATSNFHLNVCHADLESDSLNCARGGERATVATCLCVPGLVDTNVRAVFDVR